MDRLKSFPVLAIMIVIVVALLAFFLGMLTAPDGPRAVASTVADAPEESPATPPKPRRAEPVIDRAGPPSNGRPPIDRPPVRTPDRPPVTPLPVPTPRVLQPGRVDEMVTRERNETADGSIIAQMEDAEGNRLAFASLSISVNSPGLGWQILPASPQNLGEGRMLFAKLPPGQYRVRSENPNYRPAEEIVNLAQGETDRVVRLVLVGAERARVEFFIRLDTGDVPQFVTIQVLAGAAAEDGSAGRFGKRHGSVLLAPGTVHSSTARYAPDRNTGLIPFTVAVGVETKFVFGSSIDQRNFGAEAVAAGQPGLQQIDVTLKEGDVGRSLITDGEPRKLARIELTLTLNGGKPVRFTRVNLRQNPGDVAYRDPTRTENNLFVWEGILSGRWWLAVEAQEFHAAFVQQVEIGSAEQASIDIATGLLRVNALMPGNSGNGAVLYNVRLRPEAAGSIERAFNGSLAGKQSDFIDFFVPKGAYTVRVGSTSGGLPIDVNPMEQRIDMTAGGELSLTFNISAAAKVEFQCLTATGVPVPGVEFLFTTFAAGSVPETERERLGRGGADGKCLAASAPSGKVYLMIWSASKDWNNPDKVFVLDLPAHGSKDLGGLVITP